MKKIAIISTLILMFFSAIAQTEQEKMLCKEWQYDKEATHDYYMWHHDSLPHFLQLKNPRHGYEFTIEGEHKRCVFFTYNASLTKDKEYHPTHWHIKKDKLTFDHHKMTIITITEDRLVLQYGKEHYHKVIYMKPYEHK